MSETSHTTQTPYIHNLLADRINAIGPQAINRDDLGKVINHIGRIISISHLSGDTESGKKQEAIASYTQALLDLRASKSDISEISKSEHKNIKDRHSNAFQAFGEDGDRLMAAIDSALKPKAPEPLTGLVDAITTDNAEHADLSEAQAGRSTQHVNAALDATATKIADTLEPVMQAIANTPDEKKSPLLDQILKTFGLFNEDKAGDVDLAKLNGIKNELSNVMKDFSPGKFKTFLDGLDPAERKALGDYMKNVVAPMISGGQGVYVAQGVDKTLQPHFINALDSLETSLASRPKNQTINTDELIKTRDSIAEELVLIGREAKAKKSANPDYSVQKFINEQIANLAARIGNRNGINVRIYKDDISLINSHLKNTKDVSVEKQKTDINAFMNQYGKYLLMALPVILGPLTSIVSRVPIIGRPLASLAPMLNDLAKSSIAPMLMGAVMMGGNKSQIAAEQVAQTA